VETQYKIWNKYLTLTKTFHSSFSLYTNSDHCESRVDIFILTLAKIKIRKYDVLSWYYRPLKLWDIHVIVATRRAIQTDGKQSML